MYLINKSSCSEKKTLFSRRASHFVLRNFHQKIPNTNTCRKQLFYRALLCPHCPHNSTFCELCKWFSTQGNSTNPGVMFFCSPADHRTSCSLFQRCQPAKKWLFLSTCWCHWVLKAETCPQYEEGETSCPRVVLIFVCLRECCERDLFSLLLQAGSPPILLTAQLERAHPQETIKLMIILVVYALIQKCFIAKRKKMLW